MQIRGREVWGIFPVKWSLCYPEIIVSHIERWYIPKGMKPFMKDNLFRHIFPLNFYNHGTKRADIIKVEIRFLLGNRWLKFNIYPSYTAWDSIGSQVHWGCFRCFLYKNFTLALMTFLWKRNYFARKDIC